MTTPPRMPLYAFILELDGRSWIHQLRAASPTMAVHQWLDRFNFADLADAAEAASEAESHRIAEQMRQTLHDQLALCEPESLPRTRRSFRIRFDLPGRSGLLLFTQLSPAK